MLPSAAGPPTQGQGRSPTLRHKWELAKGYLWLGQGLGCSSACVSLTPNPHARILRINEVMYTEQLAHSGCTRNVRETGAGQQVDSHWPCWGAQGPNTYRVK